MGMSTNLSFRLRDIIPSQEELSEMGRRRFQRPSVFKTGGKRPMWFFRARIDTIATKDGERGIERPEERYYLGFCAALGKREAEKLRDEILSEAINKPQVLIPSQVKFSEVLAVYRRDHLAALRETTREAQESSLKHFASLGELRMCDIDALTIQRWLSGLALAYSTKRWNLALLRVIWGKAEEWGYTQAVFPRGKFVIGVNRSVKGREMPTMEQLRRLLAVLPDPYRAMAEVALYSGLRISEVRGLQWSDIEGGAITVRRRVSIRGNVDVPKSQRGNRTFDVRPLAGVLARMKGEQYVIEEIASTGGMPGPELHHGGGSQGVDKRSSRDGEKHGARGGGFIFEKAGSYSTCNDVMIAARKAAGITIARFGWHHLRGVFNTLLRTSGGDSLDRQALMGHASERMNNVYVMAQDGDTKRRGDLMLAVQAEIMGTTKGVQ